MSDKEILLERGDLERVFDFDDVMRSAKTLLAHRSKPGREYACLKFIQTYCQPLLRSPGWDKFSDGDPRVPSPIKRLAMGNWRFERRDDAGNFDPQSREGNSVSESSRQEIRQFEGEDALAAEGCEELGESRVAKDFIDYIKEKPFRKYLGDGVWYPSKPALGWNARLQAYAWPHTEMTQQRANWPATQAVVAGFIGRLISLRGHLQPDGQIPNRHRGDAQSIYNDIRRWGNPRGNDLGVEAVSEYLERLWSMPTSTDRHVDSTLTKLCAFARDDEFVIYDTRVAAAILDIAEDVFREKHVNGKLVDFLSCFQLRFPNIGHMRYASSSGSSVRRGPRKKWPNAYQSWAAQLDANRLLELIRNQLTVQHEDGREWTLREVEAVLFMEGY